jgi:hypothetical protein
VITSKASSAIDKGALRELTSALAVNLTSVEESGGIVIIALMAELRRIGESVAF